MLLIVILVVIAVNIFNTNKNTFQGKVTDQKECFEAIGTSKCTWIVEGRKVTWMWGSAGDNQKTGDIQGFSIKDNIIGKSVEVQGTLVSKNTYVLSKTTDYIKLID